MGEGVEGKESCGVFSNERAFVPFFFGNKNKDPIPVCSSVTINHHYKRGPRIG